MKVKFFIFVGLVMLISFLSFSSAAYEIGNQSHFFQQNYKEGQEINSWINISFDSETVSSVFSDSVGNSNTLEYILNSSKNSGYNFNCTNFGCVDDYSEIESFQSKSFQLGSEGEKTFGLKFNGIIDNIRKIEFDITSDAGEACQGQLEIDLGDDGINNYGNDKPSLEICEERETKSCYDENKNPKEIELNYNPYCQVFNLSSAPGFKAGLWIKENVAGDKKIFVELYDRYEIEQAKCEINPDQLSSSGDYVYCDLDYFVPKQDEYYVCVYSGNDGTGKYRTKGYYSSNSSEVCGFYDYPSQADGKTNAYSISVKPNKFGDFGTLKINESSVSGGLSKFIEYNLYERYGSLDCSSGCYFPIKIKSSTNQDVIIKNLNLVYDGVGQIGLTEDTFYELDKEGYRINSEYQKLYLDNFTLGENDEGDYSLYFKGDRLFSDEIEFKNFGISLEISNYDKVVEGFQTELYINANLNEEISKYKIIVEDEVLESSYPIIYHSFNSSGNKTIFVEVEGVSGEVFSKIEVIQVEDIKTGFRDLVAEKREKLTSIENELILLDPKIEERIIKEMNLEESKSALSNLESKVSFAKTREEYLALINEFEAIEFPFEIETKTTPENIFIVEGYAIETNSLKNMPKTYEDKQDIVDYILYWNFQNLDVKYSYEDVSVVDGAGEKIKSLRLIDLRIIETEKFSENYYLYVKAGKGLEIIGENVSEEKGYYVLNLEGVNRVQIISENSRAIENLPVFIAPDVSDLEFSFGEVEEYDKSQNKVIMVLLLFIVLLAGLVAYYFIGKWYDEKYEKKLFSNRNDVFNLINYIARSKKNGVPESKIKKNLLNSQWSNEQVRFILRKYLGKNTGMYAFFKRKVKVERKIAKEEERKVANERMQKKIVSGKSGKIKERNVALTIILSIVTLGIYYFIWLLKSSKEIQKLNRKAPNQKMVWISFGLFILTIVFMIITAVSLDGTGSNEMPFSAIVMIILALSSGIMIVFVLHKYSSAHSEITGFSKGGMFALLLLLGWIGAGIAQAQLNKVANKLQKT